MRPLEDLSRAQVRRLHGLLFDLDDTFLTHGALSEQAYSSLFRLREAGLELYAVTGRPAAWGQILVRQWPIAAAVTENGAIGVSLRGHRLKLHDSLSPNERRDRKRRLQDLVARIRRRVPELVLADDARLRVSDVTFDIGETRNPSSFAVAHAVEHAHQAGARTTRSSVHLHISFDRDDKASGAVELVSELTGADPTWVLQRYAFVGDGENDHCCFAAFKLSIAVANLSGRPSLPPTYVTRSSGGAGFTELAARLAALRQT